MRHFVLASLLAVAAAAAAPSQIGTAMQDAPSYLHDPEWIEVKLAEGSGAVLEAGGKLTSRTGADLSRIAALFARADAVQSRLG